MCELILLSFYVATYSQVFLAAKKKSTHFLKHIHRKEPPQLLLQHPPFQKNCKRLHSMKILESCILSTETQEFNWSRELYNMKSDYKILRLFKISDNEKKNLFAFVAYY